MYKIFQYLRNKKGQAMVEMAIISPIFVALVFVLPIQVGILIHYETSVLTSAREGARRGALVEVSATEEKVLNTAVSVAEQVAQNTFKSNYEPAKMQYYADMQDFNGNDDLIEVKVTYNDVDLLVNVGSFKGIEASPISISHSIFILRENV